MPNVDGILRQIAQWPYIITTDLTKAFHQIPLSRNSLKYCGVVTPFKGVRVYTRCAMGMPGSETALEELMCRVLEISFIKGPLSNWQITSTVAETHQQNYMTTGGNYCVHYKGVVSI